MTGSPRLLIRADADPVMGAGHVMRCLALAQGWREAGGQVLLLASAGTSPLFPRFEAEGAEVRVQAPPLGATDDAARTLEAADAWSAGWLVVDGYQFTPGFRRHVAGGPQRLLLIDDNGRAGVVDGDWVLDQNLHATAADYAGATSRARLLLGSAYVLLRRDFRRAEPSGREVASSARHLVLTFGGGDAFDWTGRVLEALAAAAGPDLAVTAVVGPANPRRGALEALAAARPGAWRVRSDVVDMAALFRDADLVLTAAGSTLWELAHLGVPALALAVADNQRMGLAEAARRGVVRSLGWHLDTTPEAVVAAVATLAADPAARTALAAAGRALVDGRGVSRVVSAMLETPSTDAGAPRRSG